MLHWIWTRPFSSSLESPIDWTWLIFWHYRLQNRPSYNNNIQRVVQMQMQPFTVFRLTIAALSCSPVLFGVHTIATWPQPHIWSQHCLSLFMFFTWSRTNPTNSRSYPKILINIIISCKYKWYACFYLFLSEIKDKVSNPPTWATDAPCELENMRWAVVPQMLIWVIITEV